MSLIFPAPIFALEASENLTFIELASLSKDMRLPRVPSPHDTDVVEWIDRINGRHGEIRCLDDNDDLASCEPLPDGFSLHAAGVFPLVNDRRLDRHGLVNPMDPAGKEWHLILTFKKADKEITYSAGEPRGRMDIADITESSHELFRARVEESHLVAKARGHTRPLGLILQPMHAWMEDRCQKRPILRNDAIARARKHGKENRDAGWNAGSLETVFKAARDEYTSTKRIAKEYSDSCLPGENIMGLPHLDPVWLEIENLAPKEAVTYLHKKKVESMKTIDLGGVRVEERSVRVVSPIACFALSLFLLSNLTMLRQRSTESKGRSVDKSAADYPWMGLFGDPLSRLLTGLTIFVLPVLVPPLMLLQLSDKFDSIFVLGLLLTASTALVAYRSMKLVRFLRAVRSQL